jgi:hypothetical protein
MLKQERELILNSASKKQNLFNGKLPPPPPMFSTQQLNDQDPGYGTLTDLNEFDYYKMSQLYNSNKKIASVYGNNEFQSPIRQPAARKTILSQAPKTKSQQDFSWVTPAVRYNINDENNQNNWMVGEAEQQHQQQQQRQNMRRSVPNLIDSINKSPTKSSSNKKPNFLATSNNDLFGKRKNNNNKHRQSTPSLYSTVTQQFVEPVINPVQKCAYCGCEIGQNSAMIIETLNLGFHLNCFRCSVCSVQLGNGKEGTDVRVRGNQLHCNNCFSNDRGKLLLFLVVWSNSGLITVLLFFM